MCFCILILKQIANQNSHAYIIAIFYLHVSFNLEMCHADINQALEMLAI